MGHSNTTMPYVWVLLLSIYIYTLLHHLLLTERTYHNHNHNHHRSFIIHNVSGYLQQKIAHFIMNLNTNRHNFYLTRHGQSEYNAVGRIGGDSGLSKHGLMYAQKLADFVEHTMLSSKSTATTSSHGVSQGSGGMSVPGRLWTSTMRRTRETAQFIKQPTIKIQDRDDPTLVHEW